VLINFKLAELFHRLGHYDKAEELNLRALEIRKAAFGEIHVNVGRSLQAIH
jgi:hypothetical protein